MIHFYFKEFLDVSFCKWVDRNSTSFFLNGNKFHRKLGASRNAPKYNLAKLFLKDHSCFYPYVFTQDIIRIYVSEYLLFA